MHVCQCLQKFSGLKDTELLCEFLLFATASPCNHRGGSVHWSFFVLEQQVFGFRGGSGVTSSEVNPRSKESCPIVPDVTCCRICLLVALVDRFYCLMQERGWQCVRRAVGQWRALREAAAAHASRDRVAGHDAAAGVGVVGAHPRRHVSHGPAQGRHHRAPGHALQVRPLPQH